MSIQVNSRYIAKFTKTAPQAGTDPESSPTIGRVCPYPLPASLPESAELKFIATSEAAK
jgi:hypothetical protein